MSSPFWRSLCFGLVVLGGFEPPAAESLAAGEKKPRTDLYGDPLPEGAIARLGTVRFRHASQVVSVAYSPNGKLLATAGYDKTVRVWETATGKEKFRFPLEGKPHYYGGPVAFSPDGKTLAAANGGGAGAFCLWDMSTGKELLKRALPKNESASGMSFGRGGKTLALLSWARTFDPKVGPKVENRFRLWDVAKGAEMDSFQPPAGVTLAVAFSPDGRMLAVAQEEGIHVCDPDTGKKIRTLTSEKAKFRVLAFSANGTLATMGQDGITIQLWDTATGRQKRLLRGHEGFVSHLAFSATGKELVSSSSADCTFCVWDVANGNALLIHRGIVSVGGGCVALSPDGKTVAEGSVNSVYALVLWDVATGKEVPGPQGQTSAVQLVGFTSKGKVITSGRSGETTARIWDPTDGKQLSILREEDYIYLVGLSPDGKTIAFARKDHTVCLRDLETGKEKIKLAGEAGNVQSLAFTPDGKTLAVGHCKITKGYVCTMILWDVETGKKLRQFQTPGISIESVVFSPNGKKLVSTGQGIRMWDAATGDPLGEFNGSGASGWDVVRFSPDGALLAVPSYPKGFGVWKATTREFVGRFDGDGVTVRSVAFSPDSRLLACGKEDGSVELWQVKGWKVVGKGQGPPGRVLTLRFSAAGRTLISGHEDTTALVWDVPKLLATLRGKNIQREGK